jgi:hypothetical protein
MRTVITEWQDLTTISEGLVNTHTLLVLYLTTINQDFQNMSKEE